MKGYKNRIRNKNVKVGNIEQNEKRADVANGRKMDLEIMNKLKNLN